MAQHSMTTEEAKFEKNLFDFIKIEVRTSLTFANVAMAARSAQERDNDITNARKGYETARHFIAKARAKYPNHPLSREIMQGMEQLRAMLEGLGEQPAA